MIKILKTLIKIPIETLLTFFGPHKWFYRKPRLVILMYHRILPENDPRHALEQAGMIVHPDTFSQHIKWVKKYFDIVDLNSWIDDVKNGKTVPKKACAITFDDGWQDNYQYAFPILLEESCPATIYLVSDYIDTDKSYWPEKMSLTLTTIAKNNPALFVQSDFDWLKELGCQYQFNATAPTKEQLDEIIRLTKYLPDLEIHSRLDMLTKLANLKLKFNDILSSDELVEMTNSGLINFGSHTATHTRMSNKLPKDTLLTELVHSKATIENKLNLSVQAFCYPNGDLASNAAAVVQQHYQSAVTTQPGWNTISDSPFFLKRIGLHQDGSANKRGFFSKLSSYL